MAGFEIRRLYYSMSDVSDITRVPMHTLRAWENKFPHLKPSKSRSGRRLYKPRDLKVIQVIKKLHDMGYTEDEIRNLLKKHNAAELEARATLSNSQNVQKKRLLEEIQTGLEELLQILDKK